jgi:hypothetical protein
MQLVRVLHSETKTRHTYKKTLHIESACAKTIRSKGRLQPVVEVLQMTGGEKVECAARYEAKLGSDDSASALEKEWSVCNNIEVRS